MSPAPMRMPSSAKTDAAERPHQANSGHIACARSSTAGSLVNSAREHVAQREQDAADEEPGADRPLEHPPRRGDGAPPASPAPSARPTITWPAIAIASSTSARKMKSWKAIWWAPSDGCADARADRGRERGSSRAARPCGRQLRAHRAPASGSAPRSGRGCRRARAAARVDERGAHPGLRDDGAPRRPGEAPVEAVDEDDLEHDVRGVGGDEITAACAGRRRRAGSPGRRARSARTAARASRSAGSVTRQVARRRRRRPSSVIERAREPRRGPPATTPEPTASHSACAASAPPPRPRRRRAARDLRGRRRRRGSCRGATREQRRPRARARRAAACRGGRRSRCRRAGRAARPPARRAPGSASRRISRS